MPRSAQRCDSLRLLCTISSFFSLRCCQRAETVPAKGQARGGCRQHHAKSVRPPAEYPPSIRAGRGVLAVVVLRVLPLSCARGDSTIALRYLTTPGIKSGRSERVLYHRHG